MQSSTVRLNDDERKILVRALRTFYAQEEHILRHFHFSEFEFARLFDKVKNSEDKPWLKN